ESITTCGYLPIGMILTWIVAACLISTALALGVRQLDSAIPLAGSCSVAISVAYHHQDCGPKTAAL
ncbi:hypothetical protein B0J12DRAFT_565320, partial [Macrophomina phaseolina]